MLRQTELSECPREPFLFTTPIVSRPNNVTTLLIIFLNRLRTASQAPSTNNNQPKLLPSKQIFYLCHYNSVPFCGPTAVMTIIHTFIRIDFVFGPTNSPLLTFFFETMSVVLLGIVVFLSMCAAVLVLCCATSRRERSGVIWMGMGGGEERAVKIKRILLGIMTRKLGCERVWFSSFVGSFIVVGYVSGCVERLVFMVIRLK